ncbi:hypothetical protein [Enterobacter hormaechei]
MTGFTRIVIVLGLMRNALGTPTPTIIRILGIKVMVISFTCVAA